MRRTKSSYVGGRATTVAAAPAHGAHGPAPADRRRGVRWLIGVTREAFRRFADDDHAVYAGHMAFTLMLSLGPFIVCAILFASWIDPTAGDAIRQMIIYLRDAALMPATMATVFIELVDAVAPNASAIAQENPLDQWWVVALTAVVGLYAGSSAFEAARNGFNEAYDTREKRTVFFRRSQSMFLALVIATLFSAASFLFVGVTLALTEFADAQSFVSVDQSGESVARIVLLAIFVGIVAVAFWALLLGIHLTLPRGYVKRWHLYVWAQDEIDDVRAVKIPLTPGVIVSAALWLAFAVGYSFVVGGYVDLESNHGRLAGVVATLLFFYVSAAMIFFGAQVNIALATIGPDGEPNWPHPQVERPEQFDESRLEAHHVLSNSQPDRRFLRLWHWMRGGDACAKPLHPAEEARERWRRREERRAARRGGRRRSAEVAAVAAAPVAAPHAPERTPPPERPTPQDAAPPREVAPPRAAASPQDASPSQDASISREAPRQQEAPTPAPAQTLSDRLARSEPRRAGLDLGLGARSPETPAEAPKPHVRLPMAPSRPAIPPVGAIGRSDAAPAAESGPQPQPTPPRPQPGPSGPPQAASGRPPLFSEPRQGFGSAPGPAQAPAAPRAGLIIPPGVDRARLGAADGPGLRPARLEPRVEPPISSADGGDDDPAVDGAGRSDGPPRDRGDASET